MASPKPAPIGTVAALAVAVGTTIVAAAGATVKRGVRAGGPVASAGGVVALAAVVAAAVPYVTEQYGDAFESRP